MRDKNWNDLMEKERAKTQSPGGVAPLLAELSEDVSLPDASSDYKASSFQASRGLVRLCIVMGGREFKPGGKPYRAFQYVHMDSDSDFAFEVDGQVMTLRFSGLAPVTITVRGRNLLKIWDYIQLHRMAWIRQADRDFTSDEAVDGNGRPLPFIRSIEITPVLPSGR